MVSNVPSENQLDELEPLKNFNTMQEQKAIYNYQNSGPQHSSYRERNEQFPKNLGTEFENAYINNRVNSRERMQTFSDREERKSIATLVS